MIERILSASADYPSISDPILLPDAVQLLAEEPLIDPIAQTGALISQCQAVLQDISNTIAEGVSACLTSCMDTADRCRACLEAKAQIVISQAQAVAEKCQDKIAKAVTSSYSQAVGRVAQLGVPYPPQEVIQAIARGVSPEKSFSGIYRPEAGRFGPLPSEDTTISQGQISGGSAGGAGGGTGGGGGGTGGGTGIGGTGEIGEGGTGGGTGGTGDGGGGGGEGRACMSDEHMQLNPDGTSSCVKNPPPACPPGTHQDPAGIPGICIPDTTGGGGGGGGGGGTGGGGGGGGQPGCPECVVPRGHVAVTTDKGTQFYRQVGVFSVDGCTIGCLNLDPICELSPVESAALGSACGPGTSGGGGGGGIFGSGGGTVGTGRTGSRLGALGPLMPLTTAISTIGRMPPINSCCVVCNSITDCTPPDKCPADWLYDPITKTCVQQQKGAICGPADCVCETDSNDLTILHNATDTQTGFVTKATVDGAITGYYWVNTEFLNSLDSDTKTKLTQCVDSETGGYAVASVNVQGCSLTPFDCCDPNAELCKVKEQPPPPKTYCDISTDIEVSKAPLPPINPLSEPTPEKEGFLNSFLNYFGAKDATVANETLFGSLIAGLGNIIGNTLFPSLICDSTDFAKAAFDQALIGFAKFTNSVPDAVWSQLTYTQNYHCQHLIPEQGSLDRAYVTGFLSHDQWEFGTKLHGYCVPWKERVLEGEFRYPSINEAIGLFRRDKVDDVKFLELMHRNGIRSSEDANKLFYELSNYVPSVSESVSWDQRNITDDTTAGNLSLDSNFDAWWNGDGQKNAKVYGIDQDTAKRQYRSAWTLPSLREAVAMFNRIQEPVEIPGTGRTAEPVSQEELSALADVQRIPSRWADRALYMAYKPIPLRLLQRLYVTGQVDQDGLADRFKQLGYLPDNADKEAAAFAKSLVNQRAKFQGLPTQPEILALYRQDGLSRDEASNLLFQLGIEYSASESMLDTTSAQRDAQARKSRIRAVKKRYMHGDYDQLDAQTKLQDIGVPVERVTDLVQDWKIELDLVHKEPAVGVLCDWFQRGYLSADDYITRLGRLGYGPDDATRIMEACQSKLAEKQAKQLERAIKEAAREAAKLAKDRAPCKPRGKPFCTSHVYQRHEVTHAHSAKGGEKTTEISSSQVVSDSGDTTISDKITEKA